MIIIRIAGGLGNQMLQYTFGQYLIQNGFVVKYDVMDYNRTNFHNGFLLEKVFELKINKASKEEIDEIRCARKIKELSYSIYKRSGIQLCPKYLYDTEILWQNQTLSVNYEDLLERFGKNDFYLEGTWMCLHFFCALIDKDITPFIFKPFIVNEVKEIASSINSTEAVALHFRGGDYFSPHLKKYYSVCNEQYYINAIKSIEKFDNLKYYIFSNDLDWISRNISNLNISEYTLVNPQRRLHDYHELYLMTKCKYFIIANSTFSWWAAILSDRTKFVFRPYNWFNKSKPYKILTEFSSAHINNAFFPSFWESN